MTPYEKEEMQRAKEWLDHLVALYRDGYVDAAVENILAREEQIRANTHAEELLGALTELADYVRVFGRPDDTAAGRAEQKAMRRVADVFTRLASTASAPQAPPRL